MKFRTLIVGFFALFLTTVHTADAQLKEKHEYFNRKLSNIAFFYKPITLSIIRVSVENNIPPAAMLAMVGVESAMGVSYISQVTGNIINFQALERENMLPPLRIPTLRRNREIILDEEAANNLPKVDVRWVQYPPTFVKDYRPDGIRGTSKKFDFFLFRPALKKQAHVSSAEDFCKKGISKDNPFKAFQEAREWVNKQVEANGVEILFEDRINKQFVDMISGPDKDTYPKWKSARWNKEVKDMIDETGMIELTRDMSYQRLTFEEAWGIIFCCIY